MTQEEMNRLVPQKLEELEKRHEIREPGMGICFSGQ